MVESTANRKTYACQLQVVRNYCNDRKCQRDILKRQRVNRKDSRQAGMTDKVNL